MQTHLDNSFFPSGLSCTSVHFTLTVSVPNEGLASKEHVQNVAGFKSKLLTTICDLIPLDGFVWITYLQLQIWELYTYMYVDERNLISPMFLHIIL